MTQLTDAQLRAEIERCEYCERKPCRDACPAHCSPADFIMAARIGEPADIKRAAAEILTHNPLGGICGAICPESHCMAACSRVGLDEPVQIRDVQQTIVQKAHELGLAPDIGEPAQDNGKRVGIIGAGPAGLAAAFTLSRLGYNVDLFEREERPGGACSLIPEHRLPREVLDADIKLILASDRIALHTGSRIKDPVELDSFDAVIVAAGLTEPIGLKLPGEDKAIYGWTYLSDPEKYEMKGPVAVVGGGAVAVDCAVTARLRGASRVEVFALEKWGEMPLETREREELLTYGIQVNGRTRLTAIQTNGKTITGVETLRVAYPKGDGVFDQGSAEGESFDPRGVIEHVIIAIGHRPSLDPKKAVFVAGDCDLGPSTAVQAVASGKNAALKIDAKLSGAEHATPEKKNKSTLTIPGYAKRPVSLETDFFGRKLPGPFLLSAAPPTDGYEQMRLGLTAGWAGGIMKTAFDNVPIHIPSEYMFSFGPRTWANCDNVSGHSLNRVCQEIPKLVREFPDRLIAASTGGPVTGDDEADAAGWKSNTKKLEAAGAMAIEYSLSCPQGGDGTEGDIVSQSAALTARIIEWIVKDADPSIPKLFKLTAAVTSVAAILMAIREVMNRYPAAKLGVTLANTFPSLTFRPGSKKSWEEGVVVGMSGEGVAPISNMTLAKVSSLGVHVSGNGGPMDYKAAAHFLALGARSVQFCTAAMKYGLGIIDELESGTSHLMQARGIRSIDELIGIALPDPVTDFMDLSAAKKISDCNSELCVHCGNCSRCSYLAVSLDERVHPVTDAERCVGCSICVQKCMSGALFMRERSAEELAALKED